MQAYAVYLGMPDSLLSISLISFFGVLVFAITFGVYKRRQVSRTFYVPLLLLSVYVVVTLLLAAYGVRYLTGLVALPVCVFSMLAYPVCASALLVRRAKPSGMGRTVLFLVGVLSSILYTIALFLLLNAGRR